MILRKGMLALSERHTDIKMNPVVAGFQVGFLGHTGFQVRARLTDNQNVLITPSYLPHTL